MADRLAIYRGALRLLGPSELASLSEDRPEKLKLDGAWDDAVNFLLEQGMWNFSVRAVQLFNDTDVEPLFGYQYAFRKPDDWVRLVGMGTNSQFYGGFEDYEDEAGYWYSNLETIYVRYVSNDDSYGWNIGAWRQNFAKTLEAYLAFECGLPISSDRGNRSDVYSLYEKRLARAKTLDAIDERVQRKPAGRLVRSRGSMNGSRMRG
jgi:hypothetical protein